MRVQCVTAVKLGQNVKRSSFPSKQDKVKWNSHRHELRESGKREIERQRERDRSYILKPWEREFAKLHRRPRKLDDISNPAKQTIRSIPRNLQIIYIKDVKSQRDFKPSIRTFIKYSDYHVPLKFSILTKNLKWLLSCQSFNTRFYNVKWKKLYDWFFVWGKKTVFVLNTIWLLGWCDLISQTIH